MMWYLGHGWGWYGVAAMLLTMVLIVCLLGALLYAVLRTTDRRAAESEMTADKLLMERYARGEIDEKEFERRWHVLHDGVLR